MSLESFTSFFEVTYDRVVGILILCNNNGGKLLLTFHETCENFHYNHRVQF